MEQFLSFIVPGLLLLGVFLVAGKAPIVGWLLMGLLFNAVNVYLGAAWIATLPGAISQTERYAPLYIAGTIQLAINVFQYFLFSGTLIQGRIDSFWEYVWIVVGIITVISDVIANTIPWALGGEIRASTLLNEWGTWFARSFDTIPNFIVFVLILALSLLIAIGGEACVAKALHSGRNAHHNV